MVKYPNLEAEIAIRGYKKNAIAAELGISIKTLSNKMSGTTGFQWEEVSKIRDVFFPGKDKDELFATNDDLDSSRFCRFREISQCRTRLYCKAG